MYLTGLHASCIRNITVMLRFARGIEKALMLQPSPKRIKVFKASFGIFQDTEQGDEQAIPFSTCVLIPALRSLAFWAISLSFSSCFSFSFCAIFLSTWARISTASRAYVRFKAQSNTVRTATVILAVSIKKGASCFKCITQISESQVFLASETPESCNINLPLVEVFPSI